MKNTIVASEVYWIGKNRDIIAEYGENARVLMDGQRAVMLCFKKSFIDYDEERKSNECFEKMEVFTTRSGKQYIYWRDNEIDIDYITLVEA